MTVVGARPQFVKAAALSRVVARTEGWVEDLVHTGQHYDLNMSDAFFEELSIPDPAVNLGVGSGSHGEQTGRMLAELERCMVDRRPDVVLVYGDTNSTAAAALAAAKLGLPVAHVEAGLRSYNRAMPEEINRVVADHLSDVLFAPTMQAVTNLEREGLSGDRVHLIGDVMYDIAREIGPIAERRSNVLERLGLAADGFVVATVHRAENTDDVGRLAAIVEGLGRVAAHVPVVLPLHPRTRARLDTLSTPVPERITLLEPLGYLDMAALVRGAQLVATDSGGLQKEAFFHQVPCVTLRDETEWVELVELGWNRLVAPSSAEAVGDAIAAVLAAPAPDVPTVSPYGDGDAAARIVDVLRTQAVPT